MSKAEKEKLRNMFRSYTKLTKHLSKTLQAYGLTVIQEGKHYKIQRLDGVGGCVFLSKTPSDYRGGLNTFYFVVRLLES